MNKNNNQSDTLRKSVQVSMDQDASLQILPPRIALVYTYGVLYDVKYRANVQV